MILLFGASGQIGSHLARVLPVAGETRALRRADCDLTHPDSIREAIRKTRPHVIVNAAAYTDVDRAETDTAAAHAVNATAPGVMAEEARSLGALLVHYSTAFVFDGAASHAYRETDTPNPLSEYGRSKLAGEAAVTAAGAEHLILRTNWVYDERGRNFATTLLKLALERDELRVVDDQIGAPTWAKAVADVTVALVRDEARARQHPGVYNLTALGSVTRSEFAQRLCELAARRSGAKAARVVPVPSTDYPTAAVRPLNSVLDNRAVVETFGVELHDWKDDLAACFGQNV